MKAAVSHKDKQFLNLLCETVDSTGSRIYAFQSICVGLFKSLSEFHQTLILKLVSYKSLTIESVLGQSPDYEKKVHDIDTLLINKYKIVVKTSQESKQLVEDKKAHYKIDKNFGESMKRFLSQGLELIFTVNSNTIQKCISRADQLDDKLKVHAYAKWNNLLKFMLKRATEVKNVEDLPPNVVGALEDSNLIMTRDKNNSGCFDFLLDTVKNQVSTFLYAYCRHLFKMKYKYLRGEKSQKEAVGEGNILNLVFHLTLLYPVMRYSIGKSQDLINELQLTHEIVNDIMNDLDSVGLLKKQQNEDEKKISHFATTPLINNVFNPNVMLEGGFKNDIIVETDFKIYAYSNNSEYLEALLDLFTEIKFKMPTLLVCSLEEEKIREVYKTGIKPEQILSYLNGNTHKEVRKSRIQNMTEEEIREIETSYSFIPENVVEQLIIWQQ